MLLLSNNFLPTTHFSTNIFLLIPRYVTLSSVNILVGGIHIKLTSCDQASVRSARLKCFFFNICVKVIMLQDLESTRHFEGGCEARTLFTPLTKRSRG